MQFRAEFFDALNHPNFFFGSQAYLMGTAGTVAPVTPTGATNPLYQYLDDPAAYRNSTGAICTGGPGPCYTTAPGLSSTMPEGANAEIQFALKFMY